MRVATSLVLTLCLIVAAASAAFAQQLEIHYINVGWGNSVFVKGPNGTTVLIEAGNTGKGSSEVVPYLTSVGIPPSAGLDYVIGGHQHCDHIGGLDEVINAGYNVRVRQYYNGSNYASSCVDGWNAAAAGTTAGAPIAIPVGTVIQLGSGAKITAVARNGQIIGGGSVAVSDENDRSIGLLIQYGGFDMLWASDLGGGNIDEACTGRFTSSQTDVETSIVQAISPGGAFPLISSGGIDVLHVNHHGSESSTNKNWMNYSNPAVAVIGVGAGQTSGWDLPRRDVVENVLLAAGTCITAAPAVVLQTEEGAPIGSLTSTMGYSVGNIRISTDGVATFTVSADGQVNQGPNELAASGLPHTFSLDDVASPDTVAPATAITSPADGAVVSGTTTVTASASDNVGVTNVEFYLDGVLQGSDTTSPFTWSWNTTAAANGLHNLSSRAYDAAGNNASSTTVTVTVNNVADTQPPTAPSNLQLTPAKRKITVSWTASTDNVGVTGYQIWRATAAAGPFTQVGTTTSTSFVNSGLVSNRIYFYYVTASDAAGNVSAPSATQSAAPR